MSKPMQRGSRATDPSVGAFVETNFIPHHVELKRVAGRTHYHAILKHILRPELVDAFFAPYAGIPKARLKTITDWPYLDNVRLCDLNHEHVRRLVSSALTRGYSPQTIKHIRNVISAIISHAKRERMFSGDNPTTKVELPPMTRRKVHDLTIAQAKTVLQLMRYPEREIALVTITTGMSISEICALRWKHVNLTSSTLYVDGEWIPPQSILVAKERVTGKASDVSGNRHRHVLVSERLVKALRELKQGRKVSDSNDYVIASQEGEPLRPASVRMMRLKPIAQTLEMPWLSWRVIKRGHEALLSELRMSLTDELVRSASYQMLDSNVPSRRAPHNLGGYAPSVHYAKRPDS